MWPYLYVLGQTFQGVNIEALFAGLQAGDDLLGLDAAWADCQTGEAAAEILREPRGHDLSTLSENGTEKAGWMTYEHKSGKNLPPNVPSDWYFSSSDPVPTHSDSKSFESREEAQNHFTD